MQKYEELFLKENLLNILWWKSFSKFFEKRSFQDLSLRRIRLIIEMLKIQSLSTGHFYSAQIEIS